MSSISRTRCIFTACILIAWVAVIQPLALPAKPSKTPEKTAFDLTKLTRVPSKEPKYEFRPIYGMLVLGPEGTLQMPFAFDGAVLYIDRKGTGDLTDPDARVKPTLTPPTYEGYTYDLGDLQDPVTKRKYTKVQIGHCPIKPDVKPKDKDEVEIGTVQVTLYHDKLGWFGMMGGALKPGSANILHLDGPLSFRVADFDDLPFEVRIGDEIPMQLGTQGLGKKTFSIVVHDIAPKDRHPLVEIEYPNIENGKPPVKSTFHLKQRC